MPRKTVRDMSVRERQHYSLASKTFRITILSSIVLGLNALVIGLGIYTYTLVHQYITEAFNLSKSAAAIIAETVDVKPLATDIMADYRAMTDEERDETGTDEYRERLSADTKR